MKVLWICAFASPEKSWLASFDLLMCMEGVIEIGNGKESVSDFPGRYNQIRPSASSL